MTLFTSGPTTYMNAITDQSGSGNTLTWIGSPTQTSQSPTYVTTFNSSFPAMNFVSANSTALAKTSFPMGTGNTLTAWYVGTLVNVAGSTTSARTMSYAKPASHDFDNAGSWTISVGGGATTSTFISRNNLSTNLAGLAAYPTAHRVITTINSSGVMTIYVDGVASSTTTSAGSWVSAGTFALGYQAANNVDYWNGLVAEAGVATSFSDSTAVAQLDAYLRSKWGISASESVLTEDAADNWLTEDAADSIVTEG